MPLPPSRSCVPATVCPPQGAPSLPTGATSVLGGWRDTGAVGAGACSVPALSGGCLCCPQIPLLSLAQSQLPPSFLDLPNPSNPREDLAGPPLACVILPATPLSGYHCSRFPYEETGLEVRASQLRRVRAGFHWASQPLSQCAYLSWTAEPHLKSLCSGDGCINMFPLCLCGPVPSPGSGVTSHGSWVSSGPVPDCIGSC